MGRSKNTGKKYIRLRGNEVPEPINERRAREFMEWYATNSDRLKVNIRGTGYPVDEDILGDTLLRIYDAIALKGISVKDFTGCFLRAYQGLLMNSYKRRTGGRVCPISFTTGDLAKYDAPDLEYNAALYEEAAEKAVIEVGEYVQKGYDEVSVILFEVYAGLLPDVSYRKLSALLGIPLLKVSTTIGTIKKGLAKDIGPIKDRLLYKDNFLLNCL